MIYQFNSVPDAIQFSALSETHKKVFDFVGNHKFSFDGSYVVIAHKEDTLYLSNVELNTINSVLSQYCYAIDGIVNTNSTHEGRESKIQRLYDRILWGKFTAQENEFVQINQDVALQFHNGSGGKCVGIFYEGSYCFSILTDEEQKYLWKAFDQYKLNQTYQKKVDFFNSLKF